MRLQASISLRPGLILRSAFACYVGGAVRLVGGAVSCSQRHATSLMFRDWVSSGFCRRRAIRLVSALRGLIVLTLVSGLCAGSSRRCPGGSVASSRVPGSAHLLLDDRFWSFRGLACVILVQGWSVTFLEGPRAAPSALRSEGHHRGPR